MAVKYSSEQYRFRMENVSMPTPHAYIHTSQVYFMYVFCILIVCYQRTRVGLGGLVCRVTVSDATQYKLITLLVDHCIREWLNSVKAMYWILHSTMYVCTYVYLLKLLLQLVNIVPIYV